MPTFKRPCQLFKSIDTGAACGLATIMMFITSLRCIRFLPCNLRPPPTQNRRPCPGRFVLQSVLPSRRSLSVRACWKHWTENCAVRSPNHFVANVAWPMCARVGSFFWRTLPRGRQSSGFTRPPCSPKPVLRSVRVSKNSPSKWRPHCLFPRTQQGRSPFRKPPPHIYVQQRILSLTPNCGPCIFVWRPSPSDLPSPAPLQAPF